MAQPDIEAVALTGSYARGLATENSDVDLMILTTSANRYLVNKEWLSIFGEIERSQSETWGVVDTVRAFYRTGLEIEYNFAAPSWADVPVDAGTSQVVTGGMQVLFDREHKFDVLRNMLGQNAR